MNFTLTVNGVNRNIDVDPMRRLLDVLRDDLALTGSKEGCGEGECGACTVLIDDQPANACLIPIAQAAGSSITTVEGLSPDGTAAIQRELIAQCGVQCGFCTPGIAVCAHAMVEQCGASLDREQARIMLAGNLCRCTGYQRVVDAVLAAAAPSGQSEPRS